MSRISRRKLSAETTTARPLSAEPLEILVFSGAHSGATDPGRVAEDVKLVRSALLYADRVRLRSMSAMMLFGFQDIVKLPPEKFALFFLSNMDDEQLRHVLGEDFRRTIESLELFFNLQSLPRPQRRANMALHDALKEQLSNLRDSLREPLEESRTRLSDMWAGYGADELATAIDAGVLEIDMDWPMDLSTGEPSVDRIIGSLNSNNGNVMLDSQIRGIVSAMQKEGVYDLPQHFDRVIRRTRAGTRMLENLPSFGESSMQSVLLTRGETHDSQLRYRRKISQLSRKLREHALSEVLEAEIDDFWNDEIVPEIQILQKVMNQSSAGIEAARRTANDAKRMSPTATWNTISGAGGVGLLSVSVLTSFEDILKSAAAGAAAGSVWAARTLPKRFQENYDKVLDERSNARSDGLMYLLDVERGLSTGH